MKSFAPLLAFLFLSSLISAQGSTYIIVENEALFQSRMQELRASTQTIQSDFVQEKHLSFMKEPILTNGHFYYKNDKKLRWEYTQPFAYTVILNGAELMIDDEGRKNEIDLKSNKTYQEINGVISQSMRGEMHSNNDQFNSILKENNQFFLLELTPKTKKISDYMTQIQVYFDKKDWLLSKVILKEQGGDWTKIIFTNKKVNQSLSENLFKL